MVRETGLEPVLREEHAPQTCASANSATLAGLVGGDCLSRNDINYIHGFKGCQYQS